MLISPKPTYGPPDSLWSNFQIAHHSASMGRPTSSKAHCMGYSALRRLLEAGFSADAHNTPRLRPPKIWVWQRVFLSQSCYSTFFKYVFVLRVSDGHRPLSSGANDKFEPYDTGRSGDEGNCAIRIFARADFAFPFAKIKDCRST